VAGDGGDLGDRAAVRAVERASYRLEGAAFETILADSGEKAIEVAEEHSVDVLLVDKNLPGIDGIETIRRLHQRDRNIEAVVITGYASIESVLAAIDLRAVDYLVKPLQSIDAIPAAVRRAARRRRRRLIADRMLDDLRREVHDRADDQDLTLLSDARERIERVYAALGRMRNVLFVGMSFDLGGGPRRLRDAGFTLYRTESGEEALAQCAAGAANVVIVADEGGDMSGLTFFDRLAELDGCPEAIFVTGARRLQSAIDALNRGASGYLITPLKDEAMLVRTVEQACRDHHERLYHYTLVSELNRMLTVLGDREVHGSARDRVAAALNVFDSRAASVAVVMYASARRGASEWNP